MLFLYTVILCFLCLLTVRHNSYYLFARFIECTSFLRQEFELCCRRKKQKQEQYDDQRKVHRKKSSNGSFINKLVMFSKNSFQFKFSGKNVG